MKRYILYLMVFIFLSCKNKENSLKTIEGNAIGTTFSIRYLDNKDDVEFDTMIDSIIKKVNNSLSTYISTSDISKINKGDTTIIVDEIFEEVFYKSEKIYQETNGMFDPTVGVLVNAWGFGPGDKIENLDSVKIKELLKYVGFNKVSLIDKKVQKLYPEIYFDFNAIAKGSLVDDIGKLFEQSEIENYMVEIGGEIRARGINDKGVPWRIAIENPNFDGTRSFATTIQLHNESIASSGNYRKYRIAEDGKKYVHTINTKTGYANESNLLSASVISKLDCADVDAYATALMAMGLEKSKEFLENHTELKAFLIFADENGNLKTFKTENFDN
ncbi:FAD:protein FMN transferase [Lutibacter sp. B1]|uniref:FAD:protein FMN transferase n=1 Tax=Lutibacter sp. B1 TaxID=2725996 RepID=UPI0014564F54|nr:FAD:protein FMN transferase [Lutibacter sp. B1]NLP58514.1 FAD:protein FMN transferase [Lutibacter sp. B1]